MRFFLFSLLFLILLVFATAYTAHSITGQIVNTPNCGAGHTYAFYRTPAEQKAVIETYIEAGFIPVAYEKAPSSFGGEGFMCMRRMTNKEMEQKDYYAQQLWPRQRVVSEGSSV